jgi:hypothetical protein
VINMGIDPAEIRAAAKMAAKMIGGGTGGGCGGSEPAIIDVVELPTSNIREDAFYRLITGTFMLGRSAMGKAYCVTSLPEVGEPATNADQTTLNGYYNVTDGQTYAYIDAMLSVGFGVPVGWYPASMIMAASGKTYSGVVTNIEDAPLDNSFYMYLETTICHYYDGAWKKEDALGKRSAGLFSVALNATNNASGNSSVAEGQGSQALGFASHAENRSKAEGNLSHSEGAETAAEGEGSHAEGYYSRAVGEYSHAEGERTYAKGRAAHAQGIGTFAFNDGSSARGRYNTRNGDYADVVGNGTSASDESNAYYLDWHGNGWFAGTVECAGIFLKSPNGTKYKITVNDSGELVVASNW